MRVCSWSARRPWAGLRTFGAKANRCTPKLFIAATCASRTASENRNGNTSCEPVTRIALPKLRPASIRIQCHGKQSIEPQNPLGTRRHGPRPMQQTHAKIEQAVDSITRNELGNSNSGSFLNSGGLGVVSSCRRGVLPRRPEGDEDVGTDQRDRRDQANPRGFDQQGGTGGGTAHAPRNPLPPEHPAHRPCTHTDRAEGVLPP